MSSPPADTMRADNPGGNTPSETPGDQRRILVAEDNAMNQKVILRQLMLLGFDADMAGDGREALVRWQSGHYALLLSDLHMPAMDGFELTAAIRAVEQAGPNRIPIIALTANAMQGEAKRCRDAGMDGYLSKPLQLGDLKALLQVWLPDVATRMPMPHVDDLPACSDAPVDVRVLEELVGSDPQINRELQRHFRISATEIAIKLERYCLNRQTLLASEQAHKLGSAARAVGALELGARCEEMEIAGKAGDTDALSRLWILFERELEAVNDFLDGLQRPRPMHSGGGPTSDNADANS
ncbi:MAG: response regulator [Pseudoxanthomonas sp.]